MARLPASHDEVEVSDEEFVHHLQRGGDLIARGEAEQSLPSLERARELRPRDPQVLGLLGQALYRLGRFDKAAEAYQRLVDESPVEASARVNLGLSQLKAKRYPQAVRQLEIALDLSPDHKKAMGYLGLAWLEQGEPARARPWFERAGSAQLALRCDELLAASAPLEATAGPAAPAAVPASPAAPAADAASPESLGAAPPAVPTGGAFAITRSLPMTDSRATFALERELLTIAVRGDVLTRARGLLAVRGAVRLAPEMKRFRGRPTEKPFGEGEGRVLRASGDGVLLYGTSGQHLARFELSGESAYFREDALFAFEGVVTFENGRVASRVGPDLHLVHLNGAGQILLATSGDVVALEVERDVPVRVRLAALIGWTGALTPKIGALAKGFAVEPGNDVADPVVVELAGQGRVLLDEGAAA